MRFCETFILISLVCRKRVRFTETLLSSTLSLKRAKIDSANRPDDIRFEWRISFYISRHDGWILARKLHIWERLCIIFRQLDRNYMSIKIGSLFLRSLPLLLNDSEARYGKQSLDEFRSLKVRRLWDTTCVINARWRAASSYESHVEGNPLWRVVREITELSFRLAFLLLFTFCKNVKWHNGNFTDNQYSCHFDIIVVSFAISLTLIKFLSKVLTKSDLQLCNNLLIVKVCCYVLLIIFFFDAD